MDPNEKSIPEEHHVPRTGKWLPQDHRIHREWLGGIIDHVDQIPKELHPVLKKFKDMIEGNTRIYILFSSMFEQIPKKKPYSKSPTGLPQVRDYKHMLSVLNHLLTTAPSGFAAFLDPEVNAMLKEVLNAWVEFLCSPESAQVLGNDSDGWFGETGKTDLTATANIGVTSYKFEDMYVCEPSAKYYGFKSWDAFFTRAFKEGIRPVAGADDPNVITNVCESKPYNIAYGVKARDHFWLKGQPYSLIDMLAHDELAEKFVGGTVYQAFLNALSYHRWHSPESGKIVKAYVQDGTYYSEPLFEDFTESHGADKANESTGQGYITATATRAILFIEADNPAIGLLAVLAVGMAEVSTCDITVKDGQNVKKGDQIGMFHFGGSTHCLLFRKGVKVQAFPESGGEHNVPVRSKLAMVKS
ncbi:hypothetical protein MMC26_000954 [Xylographa opegraphella]|nr:hypothetical protein [Xylographa opegraphella]